VSGQTFSLQRSHERQNFIKLLSQIPQLGIGKELRVNINTEPEELRHCVCSSGLKCWKSSATRTLRRALASCGFLRGVREKAAQDSFH
jgi:hypothetical protein